MAPAATRLTEQQRDAVFRREVSVVLSSGAGCGKTHVLTQRYLAHLEHDGAEVGQIVAITFTERAARQMRQRIRAAVVEHVKSATGEESLRWAAHLQALETAPISTIHSFCATLLRQHAVEAGLDPRFDVLEDVLAVNLETEALVGSLRRLLTAHGQPGEDLRELVLLYGWRAVLETVGHLMRTWEPGAAEAWATSSAVEIAARWREHARTVLLPRYVDHLMVSSRRIAECLRLLRRRPPKTGTQMADNVRVLEEELPRLAAADNLSEAVKRLNEAAKVGRHGVKAWDTADYEAAKVALEGFRDELKAQRLEALDPSQEGLELAAEVGRRFVRVASEAVRAYRELKRQNGVADFQDLLLLARDLLRERPEVRERLRERYRFLLIDELQDTDPVQMEVVELLCGGGLTAGRLFAVGDASQSIYRFRGAEVSLFRRLRESVAHEGRLGLTLNFRSQPAILNFTNALLGHRLQEYEPLVAHRPQVNPEPCVEFLWTPRDAGDSATESRRREADSIARRIVAMVHGEQLVAERLPPSPPLRGRGVGGEGALFLGSAKPQAAPPHPRPLSPASGERGERLRSVRPGDVVLLFRSMSNVALYEAALRHHGLDYYLVGGRAFFAQQEIYDLLNLLRALENPQDGIALAGTLRSPFCCLSDEALFVLSGRGRPLARGLWAGLHDEELCALLPPEQRLLAVRARDNLGRWRALKDRLPIARLINAVFADSGYDAATQFEFMGDRRLANLWKLVDLARAFDRSGLFGLAEFISRLGDLVANQPREEQAATQPENADVVRLMTIHQAKGLEFPIVIIPDVAAMVGGAHLSAAHWDATLGCVARPPVEEDELAFPEFGWRMWRAAEAIDEWHEDLRTLYVACTRAEDYLIVSGSMPESFAPTNPWTMTLAERFDLQTGRCLAEGIVEERRPRVRLGGASTCASRDPQLRTPKRPPLAEASEPKPIPVRLTLPLVLPVVAVEHYLRTGVLPAHLLARQHGAEDGSDRSEWHALQTLEVGIDLTTVRSVHRDAEYTLDWRAVRGADAPAFILAGRIDLLWEDADGWNVLLVHDRQPSLILAATAVQLRFGAWPRQVILSHPGTGERSALGGEFSSHEKTLDAIDAALRSVRAGLLAGCDAGFVDPSCRPR